jgi:hypothetical protein
VNEDQAAALKRLLEAGHPDAGTTVTPHSEGVDIKISGRQVAPGMSGPGTGNVEMRLRDDSPFLERYLAVRAARAIRAEDSRAAD